MGAECARGAPQELACARIIAELRHGNAAQRQRRRVVAQGNPVECAQRVAASESARGGGDQRVHDEVNFRNALRKTLTACVKLSSIYSARILAARTTFAQRAVSSRIAAAN
jgi:hypothetical protein